MTEKHVELQKNIQNDWKKTELKRNLIVQIVI